MVLDIRHLVCEYGISGKKKRKKKKKKKKKKGNLSILAHYLESIVVRSMLRLPKGYRLFV